MFFTSSASEIHTSPSTPTPHGTFVLVAQEASTSPTASGVIDCWIDFWALLYSPLAERAFSSTPAAAASRAATPFWASATEPAPPPVIRAASFAVNPSAALPDDRAGAPTWPVEDRLISARLTSSGAEPVLVMVNVAVLWSSSSTSHSNDVGSIEAMPVLRAGLNLTTWPSVVRLTSFDLAT